MPEFKIEMGSTVKSIISGFQGIITSRSEHINGCNRYWVSPSVDKDGKIPDGYWVDEQELKVVKGPSKEVKAMADHFKKKETKKVDGPGGFPSKIK